MNPSKKRGHQLGEVTGMAGTSGQKRLCNYGENCYRQNGTHFEEFSHPHLEKLLAEQTAGSSVVVPSGLLPSIVLPQLEVLRRQQARFSPSSNASPSCSNVAERNVRRSPCRNTGHMDGKHTQVRHKRYSSTPAPQPLKSTEDVSAKLAAAAPFNIFMCTVDSSLNTFQDPKSIQFSELLDKSLGDFETSLQINFMVDMDFLMGQYKVHMLHRKPLTLLYGVGDEILKSPMPPWIFAFKVKSPCAFGHHHTKMSMIAYTDGSIRIIVSTANLIEADWQNRNQGVWVSPACPKLPSGSDMTAGDSHTEFKADLLRYLKSYKLSLLTDWVTRLQEADCSKINVCFVASVPGTHDGVNFHRWGHLRMAKLLQQHAQVPGVDWPVVAQCSSIGSLGPTANSWVGGEWLSSLKRGCSDVTAPQLKLVYPSFKNVASGSDGIAGGACLPYSMATHKKQEWLTSIMYQWKSDDLQRTNAMPHIKTYTRMSPECNKLAWFHLTSANLSKAAWGMLNKQKSQFRIMSYEAGVLFLPKFVVQSTEFSLQGDTRFPMPYDLPLVPYGPHDKPWVSEYML